MTFYQELQLNQAGSKDLVRQAAKGKARRRHLLIYLFKILLTMVFCVSFVTVYGMVFGAENNIVGVVVLLCLMVFRQVDLGLALPHALAALGAIFAVLALVPWLANLAGPAAELALHVAGLGVILLLGCHNVGMGNQLTLVLGYLLLYGYEVPEGAVGGRLLAVAVGCLLTLAVYARNHRAEPYQETIFSALGAFDWKQRRSRWQVKFVLAVSTALVLAGLLHIPRPMWVGIAVMSVLLPNSQAIAGRVRGRILGNLAGGLVFAAVYFLLPASLHPFIGVLGGIGVGLSATYAWQAVFNSLGAMAIMVGVLGLPGAIFFRVCNNTFGALYGLAVDRLVLRYE